MRIIIGFTASNISSSRILLEDVLKLGSYISKIVICDNSGDTTSLSKILESFHEKEISIRLVSNEEIVKAACQGEFGEYYKKIQRQNGIAFGRTVLHRYLYLESFHLDDSIIWILDDDLRLDNSRLLENQHKFIEQLHCLRDQGVDIAVGRIVGDPPIPAASTIRTQLLDLDFNLRALCNPDFIINIEKIKQQKKNYISKYPDFYYDLSIRHSGHLETPWWFVGKKDAICRLHLLEEMLENVPNILKGVNVFRQIPTDSKIEQFSEDDIITRGGNTFVFNLDCLKDFPNISPHITDVSFRRGDTLWVTLNRRNSYKRKVSMIDIPVIQDRNSSTSILKHQSLLSDILGSSFTRAIDKVLSNRNLDNAGVCNVSFNFTDSEISEIMTIFEKNLKNKLSILDFNSWRIRGLVDSIRTQICDTVVKNDPESKIIRKHIESIETTLKSIERFYSIHTLQNLHNIMSHNTCKELESFLQNLDYYCKSYRDKLPMKDEYQNILLFLKQNVGDKQFELLARGTEGLLVTDTDFVYKFFYNGLSNFKDGQIQFIQNKLSSQALSGLKHILPLERIIINGRHIVFITKIVNGHHYSGGQLNRLLELLRECKRAGIILTNISPENLIVTDNSLTYIDLGRSVTPFEPQEYIKMCKRAYLVYKWYFRTDLKDLLHQSLTNDSLPELFGFEYFFSALENKDVHTVLDSVLLSTICRFNPKQILDYGCGNGLVTNELAKIGEYVMAFDVESSRFKEHAHSEKVTIVNEEQIQKILSSESTFDMILCNLVLCTVNDKTAKHVISNIRKLINDHGTVVLGICNPFNLENKESETHVKHFENSPMYHDHFVYHKTIKNTNSIRTEFHRPFSWYSSMIKQGGFKIQEIIEVPSTDIANLTSGSDFLILVLSPEDVFQSSEISLLIKASAMEWRTIRKQVCHIVNQLEGPRNFLEKLVVIDHHEGPFARQYDFSDINRLKEELDFLLKVGVIDRVVVSPNDQESVNALAARWFGLDTCASRCQNGQPTITFLNGLEQCRGKYILHVDSDCLIGRRDDKHDYLADMLRVFDMDFHAIAVSLPISGKSKKEYTFRNENGDWRVESRCGMISKHRLVRILPLYNTITSDELLELPWHRALDLKLKEVGYRSYRGGNPATFFIHVPNEQKKDFNSWYNIIKAVESKEIPDSQMGNVDLIKSDDWIQRRTDDCILIVRGRNVPISKLRRFFESIQKQSDQKWGLIVIDASSDNGMEEYIEQIIGRRYLSRMTFYRNLIPDPPIVNINFAIRHMCENPNSIIIMPDADDVFLCNDSIEHVQTLYRKGADVAIGGMLRADKEVHYITNFKTPRQNRGGNVWQHLRTFRKYLFDRIVPSDFKVDGMWIHHTEDWAFMLPIAEMSACPKVIEKIIYLYDPSSFKQILSKNERECLIGRIMEKRSYRRK